MRALFATFLILHGLAHLVGFLSPLGFTPGAAARANDSQAILGGRVLLGASAKWLGVLWLIGTATFAYAGYRTFDRASDAALALVVAIALSLALTAVWWPLTRIGLYINVALLAGVTTAGVVVYQRDMRNAWARVGGGTSEVRTSLGLVQYASAGSGAPVLVIHGTGGGFDQALYASGDLLRKGYRLIAPSRFGYLGTPSREDASPALEARLFAELLDSLRVRRVAVISYSAGTAPAVQFALQYPERVSALVLMVPAAGGMVPVTHPNEPPDFMMKVALKYDLPMWLTWRLAPGMVYRLMAVPPALVPTLTTEDRADLVAGAMTLFPVSARYHGTLYDAATQGGSEPLYPLERVTAPTLLVSAEDDLYDTLANARRIAQRIPGAEVFALPSGGHMLAGRRNDVAPRVAAFIAAARVTQ